MMGFCPLIILKKISSGSISIEGYLLVSEKTNFMINRKGVSITSTFWLFSQTYTVVAQHLAF